MIHRLLNFLLLGFITINLSANMDALKLEGLNKPVSMKWNGIANHLTHSLNFCIQLNSHTKIPIPSRANLSTLHYSLNVINLNAGNEGFSARMGNHSIPLELTLSGHDHSKILQHGRDTQPIHGDTFCNGPGNNLRLTIKAGNVVTAPAGEYSARIRVSAKNDIFKLSSSEDIEITLEIPKLISINGDKSINLGSYSNRDIQKTAHLCVYRNGQGTYNLKAEAPNARNNLFELQQKSGTARLPYQVTIKSKYGPTQQLTPNLLIKNLQASPSSHCREGRNLSVDIYIPKSAAEAAYPSTYQGQLKVTVEIQ